jgi:hypothetical protein
MKTEIFKRNENSNSITYGLINTVNYTYDDFGFINWRSLIPKHFLFLNEQKFNSIGKQLPSSVDGVEDSMIVIKLGGIKWLARIRGYEKVKFDLISCSPDNVIVKCIIDWIPNFENPIGVTYEEIASCNFKNADEFNLKFAESIAANRAFVRCVRNFLNINIVGEEEIFNKEIEVVKTNENSVSQMSIDPQSIFLKICKEKGMSFDQILDFCSINEPSLKDIKQNDLSTSESNFIKALDPKIAKKMLKIIKK